MDLSLLLNKSFGFIFAKIELKRKCVGTFSWRERYIVNREIQVEFAPAS